MAAAQQIANETKGRLIAAAIGKGVGGAGGELAEKKLDEVLLVEHDLLAAYTPDGYSSRSDRPSAQAKPDLFSYPTPTRCAISAEAGASLGRA